MRVVCRPLLLVWVLALAVAAAAWVYAQERMRAPQPDPFVLSGGDIGFRVYGRKGDTPIGELVVRIDGQWKPVEFRYAVRPATK